MLALVVSTGEVDLVIGKLVSAIRGDEALAVDEPEAVLGLFFGQAFFDKVLDNLFGNADAGRAGA